MSGGLSVEVVDLIFSDDEAESVSSGGSVMMEFVGSSFGSSMEVLEVPSPDRELLWLPDALDPVRELEGGSVPEEEQVLVCTVLCFSTSRS